MEIFFSGGTSSLIFPRISSTNEEEEEEEEEKKGFNCMTYSSSYVRFEQTSIMFLFEQFALHGFLSFDRIRTNDLSLSLVLVCIRITTNLF